MVKNWGFKADIDGLIDSAKNFLEKRAETEVAAKAEGGSRPSVIESVKNRIYFYSDIRRTDVLQLVRTLKELDASHVATAINCGMEAKIPIWLHINSYGGGIFDGFSAMDNIKMCESDVYTVVDGVAASAATFLSIVGDKRYITEYSTMLIHQLQSAFWGKYNEFEDEKQNLDMLMDMIKTVYKKHTNIPSKKIDNILKHDLFFKADECLKYGLVDEII